MMRPQPSKILAMQKLEKNLPIIEGARSCGSVKIEYTNTVLALNLVEYSNK
jgi:hypothetical protein